MDRIARRLAFAAVFIIGGATLSGCATPVAQVAPPPEPQKQWAKPGGTQEEFQRTRGRCAATAAMSAQISDPRWIIIFAGCMRSDGWTFQ